MQELNLFKLFLGPLNKFQISYVVTGSVAVIIYGEPRLTHDIDFDFLQKETMNRRLKIEWEKVK